MGQRCRVCSHPDRAKIENAILAGVPNIAIERRFGVSDDSVKSHTRNHFARQMEEAAMWDTRLLAMKLQRLDDHAQEVLDAAKKDGDHNLRLSGVEVAGRNIERIFRLSIGHELEERLKALEEGRSKGGDADDAESVD